MGWFSAPEYWLGRLALERGTAIIYLIAFVAAAQQFRPLIGEHGMLPVPRYLAGQSFWRTPSIFHFRYSDRVFAGVCWLGAVLSAAVVAGAASFVPLWATMLIWLTLWVLYLSIVNVGQAWYSFGWESLLLETGFLMIFLGNERTAPPILTLLLARWLLFRVEFGAGLIKMRGDSCWRSLTCLYYHHETQPMPGPLSWFFHHLPSHCTGLRWRATISPSSWCRLGCSHHSPQPASPPRSSWLPSYGWWHREISPGSIG